MEWSTRWASIVGNQCCVVHLGIIMIPMLLALMSFNMAASTRLNGGNAYILRVFQLTLKTFTAMQYGSGIVDIFVCLFVETGGKKIKLLAKLKFIKQNFKQFVSEHPFCVVIEDPRHFVCHCVLYTRNVAWRNPKISVLCKFPYTFCNIITNNRMHASHIVNIC